MILIGYSSTKSEFKAVSLVYSVIKLYLDSEFIIFLVKLYIYDLNLNAFWNNVKDYHIT